MKSKKLVFKFLLLSIAAAIFALLLVSLPFVQSSISKLLISNYLASKEGSFNCSKISISPFKIKIDDLDLKYKNYKILAPKITVNIDLIDLFTRKKSFIEIKSEEIEFNNNLNISATINGFLNIRKEIIDLALKIESSNPQNNKNISLTSNLIIDRNIIQINSARFNIGDGRLKTTATILHNSGIIKELKANVDIKNIPLSLYEIILPHDDGLYEFFQTSIKSGQISSANFDVNLNEDIINTIKSHDLKKISEIFTENNAKGEFIFTDVEYRFDEEMPSVKASILPAKIDGKIATINLKNAEISQNIVSEGTVTFDYLAENIEVIVDAKSEGNAAGLVKFISQDSMESMKRSNIDLDKIKGVAHSNIQIKIPMEEGAPNIYNITTLIKNTNLSILHGRINISNYNLSGIFNGETLKISGIGKINNFASKTSIEVNLQNKDEFSHKIDSEIKIVKSDEENAGVKFIDGESQLKISLISKNEITNLTASSNLLNSHFIIPSLAIEKFKNKKTQLTFSGKLIEGAKQSFLLSLKGEDGLKIVGSINTNNDCNQIYFEEVKYKNNDFSAKLATSKNSIVAEVEGRMIDLSQANLKKFLDSDIDDKGKLKINLKLDQIKMKNNISFTNSKIALDCVNNKCPVARLSSNIDNKDYLQIEYLDDNIKPKWRLESNEAGKIFAALGITKNIKNGTIKAVIDAPITNAKIPDYSSSGYIEILNVDTTKNKFLTKMISFISIPGLLGAITNKDVKFDKIASEITIKNRVIQINKTSAEGPFFYFHSKGNIDLETRKIEIRGQVVPSLYGMNKLAGSLPVLKYLFGNRGGVVFTPFFFQDSF